MRLADEADGLRACIQHSGQHIVIFRRAAYAFGHPERRERGFGPGRACEEFAVRGVRTGPAALNIVDAERVQHGRDLVLFRRGELHALRLLTVAQCGVVEGEAGAGHGWACCKRDLWAHGQRPPVGRVGRRPFW